MRRVPRKVLKAVQRAPAAAWERVRHIRRRRTARRPAFRHLFEEASLHLSATVSELADWIRLGH